MSSFSPGLTEETLDTIVAHAATKTSPMTAVALFPINGVASRVGQQETAFPTANIIINFLRTC